MPLSPDQKRIIDKYLDDCKYSTTADKLYNKMSNKPLANHQIYSLAANIKSNRLNKKFKSQEITINDIISYICAKYKLPLTVDEIRSSYSKKRKPDNPVGPPLQTPTVNSDAARGNRAERLKKRRVAAVDKALKPGNPSKRQRTK